MMIYLVSVDNNSSPKIKRKYSEAKSKNIRSEKPSQKSVFHQFRKVKAASPAAAPSVTKDNDRDHDDTTGSDNSLELEAAPEPRRQCRVLTRARDTRDSPRPASRKQSRASLLTPTLKQKPISGVKG